MARAYVGLGSNLGDRERNLREALRLLGAGLEITAVSSFYETDPVGYLEQAAFVNAVCCGETNLAPRELLALSKSIEAALGRQPTFANGPRVIDLDILSYDNKALDTPDLAIPHPRLPERAFVLVPLAEIAPDWKHPLLGKTASELASAASRDGVRLLPRQDADG